jgi:hypothetical protein
MRRVFWGFCINRFGKGPLHTRFEPFRFWLQIRGDIHNPLAEFSLKHSEKLLLLRKHKHFDIEAYYRNKTKTFWFGPLFIGTKAERFNLFQKIFEIESERFGDFLSLKTKPELNRINLLSHRNVSIYLGFRGNQPELLRTISNFFYQFGTFLFAPSYSGTKQNFFI